MEDWEEELEANETPTLTTTKKDKIEIESEVIIKVQTEFKPQSTETKENPDDYERKWQEKNKELIDRRKKEELETEGMSEKDKQKKLIEMRIINDAADMLEGEQKQRREVIQEVVPLVTEKDFIDFAVYNTNRIKTANKPTQFTLKYMKNTFDVLGLDLDADKLDLLIKDMTVLFNKKLKEKQQSSGKPPSGHAKPTVSAGKGLDRAEKMGAFDDFGVGENVVDEDYYEDDFI